MGGNLDTAREKFSKVKDKVNEAWDNIKKEIPRKWDEIKTVLRGKWDSIVSGAKTWGGDLCSSLASGIKGAIGKVTSAAKSVADKIASYLHFSEPDIGPFAAAHGGNWIMSDAGKLLLVPLWSYPPETNYLVTEHGEAITFGGVRILVG